MPRRKFKKITRNETPPRKKPLQGQSRYECPEHGFLVDVLDVAIDEWPNTAVRCPCGRFGVKQ